MKKKLRQSEKDIFSSNSTIYFFYYWFVLNNKLYRKSNKNYIGDFSRQWNQENLNLNLIWNLDIFLPSISLQNKFTSIVEKNEEIIPKQKESLKKLEEFYNGMMQESFRV